MKRIISLILCLCIFITLVSIISIAENKQGYPEGIEIKEIKADIVCISYAITAYKNNESAKLLWEFTNKYAPTKEMTAAIMGFFWRESFLRSDAVGHWPELNRINKTDICREFSKEVDEGLCDGSTKEYFIKQARKYGGYGLGQWYSKKYLEAFYDFAQDWGTSIADAEMQCAFTVWSIQHQHKKYLDTLNDYSDLYTNSLWMGTVYDGSKTAADTIYAKAEEFYKNYK